jgi:asparagine synthase (glutamine-hydrolysing)
MCGIAGRIGSGRTDLETLHQTLSALRHRGPDSSGLAVVEEGLDSQTALLHSRLSIIDLDPRSNQPMEYCGRTLVFNGEIYNYRELRSRLQGKGVTFTTGSDTEVLLKGIVSEGWKFLDQLEGMWAFALYDGDEGTVTLSRDRFGEKPLYTAQTPGGLMFASEIRVLETLVGSKFAPNFDHVRRFLVTGYKSLYKVPETFLSGVTQVPAGTVMQIASNGAVSVARYWNPRTGEREAMTFEAAVRRTREELCRSVELRLRADVPLAFSLSGGIDSVALASLARRELGAQVHGFTIMNTDPRYEERALVEQTVEHLGIDHTWIPLETEEFLPRLRSLIANRGEPLLTITSYVQSLLMREVSSNGYRVIVGGSGADELFSGYYDHHLFYLAAIDEASRVEARNAWRKQIGPIVRNPFLQDPDQFVHSPHFRGHIYLDAARFNDFLTSPIDAAFVEDASDSDPLRNRMLNELFAESVPVLTHEEDLNAMAYSLENRSPFLDRRLAEFTFSIPTELLIQNGYAKAVLRESVRGFAPDAVLDSSRKVGFNAPISDLLPLGDPKVVNEVLSDSLIWEIVDRTKVSALLANPLDTNSESKFLFSLVSAKLFLDTH